MEVVLRDLGFDDTMISTIHDMMDLTDDDDDFNKPKSGRRHHPSRDAKAMKSTPADVVEFPTAYHFILDMPGLKPEKIKAHIEDGNVLVVSGEPRRRVTKQEGGAKLLKMERRMGKMLKEFVLPENADKEKVSAVCEDGVLTVVVEKVKAPEVKKPRVIEVKIGGGTTTGEEALHKGEGVKKSGAGNWHDTAGSHGEGTDEYQGLLKDAGTNLHDQTPGTQGDRVPQVAVL